MEAKDIVLILSTIGTFVNGVITTILAAYAIKREAAVKEREALFSMFIEHFQLRDMGHEGARVVISKKS